LGNPLEAKRDIVNSRMIETVPGKLLIKDPPRATSRVYVPVPWGMSLPTSTTYVPVAGGANEITGSGVLMTIDPSENPLGTNDWHKITLPSRFPIPRFGSASVPLRSVTPHAAPARRHDRAPGNCGRAGASGATSDPPAGLARDSGEAVQSLRRDCHAKDRTCGLHRKGWCLSRRPPVITKSAAP
jgi:hypothetical protein